MRRNSLDDRTLGDDVLKKSIVRYALLCMVFFIVGKTVLFWAYIPSISMEPTLSVGNVVLGNRLDRIPERYDIILFRNPENKKQVLIKRVIGLPGETIEMKSGCVYVDGQKVNEPYLQEKYNDSGSYQVSKNSYFVMGDNRNHSYDKRCISKSGVCGVSKASKNSIRKNRRDAERCLFLIFVQKFVII